MTTNTPWRVRRADGQPYVSFGWSPDNEAAARSFVANMSTPEAPLYAEPARLEQLAIAPDASIVSEPVQAPEPRHEAVKLFEPAPAQLPGQLTF